MRLLLKNLLFTLLVPGTVAGVVPWLVVAGDPDRWGWPQLAALAPALAGLGVYARCVWDFARRGRATPAPVDAPRVLVVEGLYRYVRNPMYLGVLLVLVAEVLFFGSRDLAAYVLAWFLVVHLFILLHEEPTLLRRFGDSYARYRGAVRRWMPGRPYRGA